MNISETCKDLLRPVYRQFLAYKHKGDKVACNICGRSFNRLRPVMGRHADGSVYELKDHVGSCWLCNSYPRTRQLYYWLVNDFKLKKAGRLKILHIAPEVQISYKLRDLYNIDYTCIDKRCPGYSYPDFVKDGDVSKLEFADNSFDMLICNHVLEHIIDDVDAMKEIYRVLKDNGIAILMVPIDVKLNKTLEEGKEENLSASEREQRFGQSDHVRIYGLDYFDRLRNVGFSVERISYNHQLTAQYGFMPGEEVIVCRKN